MNTVGRRGKRGSLGSPDIHVHQHVNIYYHTHLHRHLLRTEEDPEGRTFDGHTEIHPHGFADTHDHGRGGAGPHSHKERDTHPGPERDHHDHSAHVREDVTEEEAQGL